MLIGHRDYVGGMWDEIGQLQFDFLVSQGLTPEHVFLDVACGSLRGGVHFIDYLNPGKYLGIEKEKLLIKKGIENELAPGVLEAKRPEFVASGSFEFERFSKRADYSLAQSLFTHLNSDDLALCLSKLRANVNSGHELYATFGPGASDYAGRSHALGYFQYSPDQLSAIGLKNGWRSHYIGDWGHPRGQMMMQFVAD
jgi:hypothetical protein